MKATLATRQARNYTLRVGSETCSVRGFDIEAIDAIFPDASAGPGRDAGMVGSGSSPWQDVVDADEIVSETMISAPAVRKRSRPSPSRALLLGVVSAEE